MYKSGYLAELKSSYSVSSTSLRSMVFIYYYRFSWMILIFALHVPVDSVSDPEINPKAWQIHLWDKYSATQPQVHHITHVTRGTVCCPFTFPYLLLNHWLNVTLSFFSSFFFSDFFFLLLLSFILVELRWSLWLKKMLPACMTIVLSTLICL